MRAKLHPEDVTGTKQIIADIVSEKAVLCSDSTENVTAPENASHDVKADPINNNKKKEIQNIKSDGSVPSVKAVLDRGCEKSPRVDPVASHEKCCDDKQSDVLQKSLFDEDVASGAGSKNSNVRPNDLDSNAAKLANIFDSHCHVDRVYNYWNHPKVENPVENLSRKFPEVFGRKFEGCIAVNCDPRLWRVSTENLNRFLALFLS